MSPAFRRTLVALAAAAMLSPAASASGPPATQSALHPSAIEAAAVVDRFHQALASGDLAAAAGLLDASALIYESGGVERSKAEYQAHHLPADAAFSKAVQSVTTLRSGGSAGGLAWVASESRMTGSYQSKPVDRRGTETMVLRQSGAGWKIIHIHWSSGAAPKR